MPQKNLQVAVILSTYNPNIEHLKIQLDSIAAQTYRNITIYIRDDGSSNGAVQFLQELSDSGKIIFDAGSNLGFCESFLAALTNTGSEDYYAFCDQDDYWMPDKIESALRLLGTARNNEEEPLLYYSDYEFCNDDLQYIAPQRSNKQGPSFRNSLVGPYISGMTMVFNTVMKRKLLLADPKRITAHDWLAYMIATSQGGIVHDPEVLVKYRRHGRNVSSTGNSFLSLLVFRIKSFLIGSELERIQEQIIEFDKTYNSFLSNQDKKLISLFLPENKSLSNRLKKVFFPKMFRQTISEELMCRFIFLIGKL